MLYENYLKFKYKINRKFGFSMKMKLIEMWHTYYEINGIFVKFYATVSFTRNMYLGYLLFNVIGMRIKWFSNGCWNNFSL